MDKKSLQERFFDKIAIPDDIMECWEWQGLRQKQGYGMIREGSGNSNRVPAHRVSYSIFYHEPGNMMVCHRCDNPPCVNPLHLFLGTALDNNHDMIAKKRSNFRGNAKLSDEQVREILQLQGKQSQRKTAQQWNVNPRTIRLIWERVQYKHVT